jgi:hypothetical protein
LPTEWTTGAIFANFEKETTIYDFMVCTSAIFLLKNPEVACVVADLLKSYMADEHASVWAGHGPEEAPTHARWNGNLLGTSNPQLQLR